MNVRLTEASRRAICVKALQHALGADEKKLADDDRQFSEDVYAECWTESERRRMARLPKGWLYETCALRVQFGSSFTSIDFAISKRVPYDVKGSAKQFNATHKLTTRYDELKQRRSDLKARRNDLDAKVMATLKSVTTLKRLHEVWPESKQFTTGVSFEIANLPALPVKQLNKLLGIAA